MPHSPAPPLREAAAATLGDQRTQNASRFLRTEQPHRRDAAPFPAVPATNAGEGTQQQPLQQPRGVRDPRAPPAPPTPGSSGEGSTCPPPRPGTAPAAGSPRDRCAQPTPTAELQGRPPAPQSRRPSCAAVAEREEPSNLPSSPRSAQCAAAAPEPPQSPSRLGRTCREEEEPQSAVAGPVPCRCLRRCSCPSSRTTVRPSALHRPGPAEAVLRDGSGKEARAGLGNNSRSGAET